MRRFELAQDTSNKFWEIGQTDDLTLDIRWGRIGTAGQSQTKTFANAEKTAAAMEKLVKEKTAKGYAEVGGTPAPEADRIAASPSPAAEALPESLDAQCDRVFEAVRLQIAEGRLVPGDPLTAGQLKRQFAVSDQGAAMAFERLINSGMIHGWGTTAQVQGSAQALAQQWALRAIAVSSAGVQRVDAAEPGGVIAATGDVPPWFAQGAPLRLEQARMQAYASRRHPQPIELPDAAANWQLVREDMPPCADPGESDAALRPALLRMIDRFAVDVPGADAEADALLLALTSSNSGYYGENELGRAVVDQLVMCYGLVGAVEVYLAAAKIQVNKVYSLAPGRAPSRFSTTVKRPMCDDWSGPFGTGEERLRSHLAVAPEDQWQACVDLIEAALPVMHPSRQSVAAMLLPDRPALSNALALSLTALKDVPESAHFLLLTATDPAAIAAIGRLRVSSCSSFWCRPRMVATLLLERGVEAIEVLERGAAQDEAGDALACIGTPEAVSVLAKVVSTSKAALARLALAAERWPLAALVALSRVIAQNGKDAGLLTSTLTRLLRTHDSMVDSLRPWMDSASQNVIDRQLALLAGPANVATAAELPGVLASPPWLSKGRKKAATPCVLQPLALAPMEQWNDGARESALAIDRWQKAQHAQARNDVEILLNLVGMELNRWFSADEPAEKQRWETTMTALRAQAADAIQRDDAAAFIDAWRKMIKARKEDRYFWFWLNSSAVTVLPPALALGLWNAVAGEVETRETDFAMATLGLPALPGLLSVVRNKPTDNLALALSFGAVELALPAARAFAKLKSVRDTGRQWLLKFPEHAACGLIAPALGKAGEARDCAGAALRLLQGHGHETLLLEVAGRYGNPAVVEALRAVLEESPLDRFPTRLGKLPAWWQPHGWRRPVLRNGKALPDPALDHMGQMLGFPTNEEVYAGIAVVKEACSGNSLADFAWDAFTAWLEAGGPSKEGWGLTALGLLGNDDTARQLTPFIRAWPGESAHARAVAGLDVLAMIGTDVALMLLNGIAQKLKFKGLQDKAREKINAIAEARGLSTEELEDRLAPDLGLDARGTLTLDFGPRAFKVAFDESLKPYVRELNADATLGARLADLPKPRKSDDQALAKTAVERFKLLKKDARTIASQQLLRLEVAMCTRRRWMPELFHMFLAEHPLVRHIVHRLVWGVYDLPDGGNFGGALTACFRVAEDGSFTDAEDDVFELPEGQNLRIGVPHALEIPPADAAAFGQVFADYELLQPFAQIGRDTYTLDEAELSTKELVRWKGVVVPTGRVLGLVNKGWRRGQAQDAGGIWYFTKPLGNGKVIELNLDPGIIVGMVDEYPEQTLGDVQVGKPSAWGDMQNPAPFSTLDAISASELIRDMEALRA